MLISHLIFFYYNTWPHLNNNAKDSIYWAAINYYIYIGLVLVTVLHKNPWKTGWMKSELGEKLPTRMRDGECKASTLVSNH